MHLLMVFVAACAIWSTFLSSALAASFGEKSGKTDHDDHVMAGMKGVTVSELTRTSEGTTTISGYGAAGFGEATLLHDHLALELAFVVTAPAHELSLSADPLIKVPLHVSSWLEPYAATGPMVVHVRDAEGRRFWMGGGQIVLGTYLWLASALGIDFDVSVGAARGPDMTMMELVFAVGPILRD
jgi:hypothetical protein